jgi:hypothetical protein
MVTWSTQVDCSRQVRPRRTFEIPTSGCWLKEKERTKEKIFIFPAADNNSGTYIKEKTSVIMSFTEGPEGDQHELFSAALLQFSRS